MKQIDIANVLLQVSLLFVGWATQLGVACTVEHPSEPNMPEAASIWRLPEVQWLLSLEGVCKHTVLQGLFGGVAAKPTHFMTFGLDSQQFFFRHWSAGLATRKWWIKLVGKDSEGRSKTSHAKAYPPLLNAALMEAYFMRAVVVCAQNFPERDSSCFSTIVKTAAQLKAAADRSGWSIGPGYAPE